MVDRWSFFRGLLLFCGSLANAYRRRCSTLLHITMEKQSGIFRNTQLALQMHWENSNLDTGFCVLGFVRKGGKDQQKTTALEIKVVQNFSQGTEEKFFFFHFKR